jgi:hypothetical protein
MGHAGLCSDGAAVEGYGSAWPGACLEPWLWAWE